MKKEEKNNNMAVYDAMRQVPQEALKTIGAGRLKGMSDINPMWRIQKMTEVFGLCGIGWKYEITKQWNETYGNEVKSFCNVNLYVKVDGEWSEPIPGTGGSSFVSIERNGAYVSDECLDGDCELLTKEGWVKLKDYEEGSGIEVAQYYPYSGMIDFYKPLRFIHKQSSDVYDKEGFLMTAKHRHIVYSRGKKDYEVLHADELAQMSYAKSESGYGRSKNFRDIKCGYYAEKRQLSTIDKIGIMLACDGTIYRVNSDGKIFWRVEFTKERKIKKAKLLLDELGVPYKKNINERGFGNTTSFVFELKNNINYKEYKNFLPYGNYDNLWEEIVSWDGFSNQHDSFFTTNRESAEYLQTLLCLSGQVVSIYKQKRDKENHNDIYTLYRKKHSTSMSGFKKVDGTFDVYCVEVPTTFILTRKNGEILVTGNCHKMSLTDALSVAMKALGMAADVYFTKGVRLETKYEQPAVQPQQDNKELNEAFMLIKANIESAPSRDYLKTLNSQQPEALRAYAPYKAAMNKRYKEVS